MHIFMLSLNQVIVLLHQSFYCPVSHALFHPIYSCGWTKFEQYSIYSIFLYSDNQLVCLLSKLERKCKIYTVTVVSRDVTVHREVAKNRYKCVTIGISKKKKKIAHQDIIPKSPKSEILDPPSADLCRSIVIWYQEAVGH